MERIGKDHTEDGPRIEIIYFARCSLSSSSSRTLPRNYFTLREPRATCNLSQARLYHRVRRQVVAGNRFSATYASGITAPPLFLPLIHSEVLSEVAVTVVTVTYEDMEVP